MATLLSFRRARPQGWSNEEKAQFARIQKLLGDAGIFAEIEHGLTDEGDPWCAICSGNSGDVIIHVARIDGSYLFDSAALPTTIKGRSLDDCAQRFIDDATVLSRRPQHGSTVSLHPSAMLAGVILTIFLYLEALGESPAHGKALLELDAEAMEGAEEADAVRADIIEVDSSAASPNDDEGESPLLVLKQMLQQIAEAVQKPEGDRTGAQGASQGQGWGSALLSSGAVVAAIAYAQESIGRPNDDEQLVASTVVEDGAEREATPADLSKEAPDDRNPVRDTSVVDAAEDSAPIEADTADAARDDFLSMERTSVAADGQQIPVQPTILIRMPVEDRFVFADDPAPAPQDAAETVAEATPAPLSPVVEDVSAISRLVRFMSDSSIEIRDEVFDLRDFIEIVDGDRPGKPGIVPEEPFVTLADPLPSVQADALVFQPFEPPEPEFESLSTQDIAERITAFVQVTGRLRYDMTDPSNVTIYDRSVIGFEDIDDIVHRSFTLPDGSFATFIGLRDEIDMVFAA